MNVFLSKYANHIFFSVASVGTGWLLYISERPEGRELYYSFALAILATGCDLVLMLIAGTRHFPEKEDNTNL